MIAVLVLVAGCAAGVSPPDGTWGGPAAPAVVERFLHLAAEADYVGMGWTFGTTDGAILERDPQSQVERRMYALASLLAHDSFVVGPGTPVPGRLQNATDFQVTLQRAGRTVRVPFTAVRGPQDRWYVERLDVEVLTAAR